MPAILKPANLSLTWASGGDVLNPGDTKYASGWAVEIPARQWFNYLDNRQDTALAHINQHGVVVWDATTEYQEDKSYVQGTTNGTIYRCIQTHINQDPEFDVGNVYWIIAFASAGDFYTKAQTDAAYLARASNLADLTNTATARTNLSVYSQAQTYNRAEVDTKTTVASTAQAQAGVSNTVIMTPLRTNEWGLVNVIGMGQTWQNLLGSRAASTLYTNSTGRPITVSVGATGGDAGVALIVAGVTVAINDIPASVASSNGQTVQAVVPAGATYQANLAGGTLGLWAELR